MSYPQPSSISPVLAGQTFFRLKTALLTQGDMYESEVSALGFALGPDSDLANVQVCYPDANSPGGIATAIISSDRALVGRFDARNDIVLPVGARGRILLSPADYYNPFYQPIFAGAGSVVQYIAPVMDVIQYFSETPSIGSRRSDRTTRLQYLQTPAVDTASCVVIPAYGRKSGFINITNRTGAGVLLAVRGINYGFSGTDGGAPQGSVERTLVASGILANGGTSTYVFKASTDGQFDAIYVCVGGVGGNYTGGAIPTTIQLSDDVL